MSDKANPLTPVNNIPETAWGKLSEKKIYFGHQSVGNNIIDGINKIMQSNNSIKLNIIKTNNPDDFDKPIFAHSSIGKNDCPESKITAFKDYMDKGIGNKADIAFFKLCFADIIGTTDVNRVFNVYRNTMSHLKRQYPKTTFVHVTVPLLSTKKTFTTRIKRMVGKRDIWGYDGNIKRNDFNELLRKEYEGKEPVFDPARIESTYADGRESSFTEDGKTYYSLIPEYTNDGGHLNNAGKKVAAEQLLIFLANLSEGKKN